MICPACNEPVVGQFCNCPDVEEDDAPTPLAVRRYYLGPGVYLIGSRFVLVKSDRAWVEFRGTGRPTIVHCPATGQS